MIEEINELLQNSMVKFLLITLGALILAKSSKLFLKMMSKKFADKTKSDLDNILILIVSKPLYYLIILAGLYSGLELIPELERYSTFIDRIFFTITVLIIANVVSKILSVLVNKWFKVQKRFEKTPQLLNKIITFTVYLVAILMILGYYKINITPLVATLGIGGLAIGLALQNTLSNFFSGLHIISDGPVNVGDHIELDKGVAGKVEDIGWRSTRIKTGTNTTIIIPNLKLAESIITNNSLRGEEVTLHVACRVSYDCDLKKVERITLDVAKKIQNSVKGAVKNFEPTLRFQLFGEYSVNFTVFLKVENHDDATNVTHEFIKALKERYDKEKIEIPYPSRRIYNGKQR